MAGTIARLMRAAFAVTLACAGLLMTAGPSAALTAWGVESPAAGTRLVSADRVPVIAFVDHASWEEVQRVEARFSWGGTPVGVVRRLDLLDSHEIRPGLVRSRFAAPFDPMSAAWFDFRPAPNGRYQIHARVQYAVQGVSQEPSPWSPGQDLALDVPPPRPTADASLTDPEARTVTVAWQPGAAGMADFTRYVVERSSFLDGYTIVHQTTDPAASQFTDTVPADADYRYRVTAYRSSADGGELSSPPSETTVVSVHPGAPAGPGPTPGEEPPAAEPGAEPGAVDPQSPDAGPRSGSSWRPWVFPNRAPRAQPQTPAQRPRTATAPEDDTFEELLDYGDTPHEWEVSEREIVAAAPEGGTISVFSRELQTELILVPVAAGLVLVMTGFHVRRFLNP